MPEQPLLVSTVWGCEVLGGHWELLEVFEQTIFNLCADVGGGSLRALDADGPGRRKKLKNCVCQVDPS